MWGHKLAALLVLLAGLAGLALDSGAAAQAEAPRVAVMQLKGVINPVVAQYLARGISTAQREGAVALVIQLDTPGGLESSMREINQVIINSPVPVVVYVAPPGARAASAGLFIAMAAHVAAMAPGTNIGSATPVTLGGPQGTGGNDDAMRRKVTNDAAAYIRGLANQRGRNAEWAEKAVREAVNASAKEALDLRVVDLLADDLPSLLRALDGREVSLASGKVVLRTQGAQLLRLEMNPFERLLHTISDPTIAYILLIVGINGLIYELASPGAILPGVVGVIALLLAFYALGTLPVNLAGLALIILAFGLLLAELKVQSHGILTVGGIVSLLLGSVMLINPDTPYLGISPVAIATVVLFTAGFFALALEAVVRAHRRKVDTGREGLVGALAEARTDLDPTGMVFVHGERWMARSEGNPVSAGQWVRVTQVEGLRLTVRPEPLAVGVSPPPPLVERERPALAEPPRASLPQPRARKAKGRLAAPASEPGGGEAPAGLEKVTGGSGAAMPSEAGEGTPRRKAPSPSPPAAGGPPGAGEQTHGRGKGLKRKPAPTTGGGTAK